jgi:hypothetical protein
VGDGVGAGVGSSAIMTSDPGAKAREDQTLLKYSGFILHMMYASAAHLMDSFIAVSCHLGVFGI